MTPAALVAATNRRRVLLRERAGRRRPCGIVSSLLVCLTPLLGACSGVAPERRVEVRTRVRATSADSVENAWGWTVSVESAWLSIGSLRLLEGEPLGRNQTKSEPWWQGWLLKTAHAHPGHYQEGNVLAEMLEPAGVDLTGVTELAPSQAVTGQPHSGRITFGAPLADPTAPPGETWLVRVVGRAERAGDDGVLAERRFVAVADEELAPAEVHGCPFQGGPLRSGGLIELRVDLSVWFDQVDFTDLPAGTDREATPLATDARANNGFLRGLEKASAYAFGFQGDTR